MTRSNQPYKDESKYSHTKKQETDRLEEVDAHEFLAYCRLRGEVANVIREEITVYPSLAVIGFLTGSVGLLNSARPYVEMSQDAQLSYSRGLSHNGSGEKKNVSREEYFSLLDAMVAKGIHHIVLVDEIVGGGQMSGGLNATAEWQKEHPNTSLSVSVIGCYDGNLKPNGQFLITKLRGSTNWNGLVLSNSCFPCAPTLLEKDKQGLAFRAVKKSGTPGSYNFERECPAGFSIVCPYSGEVITIAASKSSLDQLFGNYVAAILGQTRQTLYSSLTQRIKDVGCKTCCELLNKARQLGLPKC
jgi:hypothetical protein